MRSGRRRVQLSTSAQVYLVCDANATEKLQQGRLATQIETPEREVKTRDTSGRKVDTSVLKLERTEREKSISKLE